MPGVVDGTQSPDEGGFSRQSTRPCCPAKYPQPCPPERRHCRTVMVCIAPDIVSGVQGRVDIQLGGHLDAAVSKKRGRIRTPRVVLQRIPSDDPDGHRSNHPRSPGGNDREREACQSPLPISSLIPHIKSASRIHISNLVPPSSFPSTRLPVTFTFFLTILSSRRPSPVPRPHVLTSRYTLSTSYSAPKLLSPFPPTGDLPPYASHPALPPPPPPLSTTTPPPPHSLSFLRSDSKARPNARSPSPAVSESGA